MTVGRRLSPGEALLWAVGAVWLLWSCSALLTALLPGGMQIAALAAAEVVALLIAVFLVVRIYAPEERLSAALAIRPADVPLVGLGLALGVVVHLPSAALRVLMESWLPTPPSELLQRGVLLSGDRAGGLLTLLVATACVVPLVEELLVRGALFGGLVRSSSRTVAIGVTALCFVVLHLMQWRNAPMLLLTGAVLGFLRGLTGSILPSLAMHAAFNATTVLALGLGWTSAEVIWRPASSLVLVGVAAMLGLVWSAWWLAERSAVARAGRASDGGEWA